MKYILLIALVAFLLARRIQRSIGFQKYKESTLTVRMVIFIVLAILFLSGCALNVSLIIPDVIGIIAGLVLAYVATNHAIFEKREDGIYFKTHIWVEIVVVALFLFRFAYRMYLYRDMFQSAGQDPQEMQARMQTLQDPFTGAAILAFCAYYVGYYRFIIREAKKSALPQ